MSTPVTAKIDALTVVLPVFNEERIIETSVSSLAETLEKICLDYEILVVDDGSTDRTPAILERLAGSIQGLRVLHYPINKGLGGALQYGFQQARTALVFYTDADMPFQYSEIVEAAKSMEASGADMVVGFRKNRALESAVRRLCSMAYNLCIRVVYGVHFQDINCAFKLIRSSVLERVDLKANGSFIDAELIIKASYSGFRIREFGVEYHPRQEGDSRLFRFHPILRTFLEMAKLHADIQRTKRWKDQDRGRDR